MRRIGSSSGDGILATRASQRHPRDLAHEAGLDERLDTPASLPDGLPITDDRLAVSQSSPDAVIAVGLDVQSHTRLEGGFRLDRRGGGVGSSQLLPTDGLEG